jgi:hypothetical protein
MVCTENVPAESCAYKRNMISMDGLHWCLEYIGGRVMAAMACLLQCPLTTIVMQGEFGGGGGCGDDGGGIKECERTCSMQAVEI